MTPTRRHWLAAAALTFGLLASACGSDSPERSATPDDNTAASGQPANDSADDTATDGDVCATVPSLDAITAQLGEPVTGVQRLERGPGTDLCEAAGAGVGTVQFTRVTPSSRDAVAEMAGQLGYPATDLGDPALPGAITYAGTVSVFVGDVEYTVQAFAADTVGDPASALATERSAALLAAWLQNLGVAL